MTRQNPSNTRIATLGLMVIGLAAWLFIGRAGQAETVSPLVVTVSDSADPVNLGETVTYTITVQNTATDEETGVVVEDTLTGPASIRSAVPSQGSCTVVSSTAVTCALGTIGPGGQATIIVSKQTGGVGGIAGLLDAPDAPRAEAGASGGSSYAVVVALGGAIALLAAGGWFARRRFSRN